MPRFLTALLVLAVLVWSAANAPGWSLGWGHSGTDTTVAATPAAKPTQDPILLAALDTPEDLDIAAWLDRAQQELDAHRSAWNQIEIFPLDTSFGAENHSGRRYGGGASGDALLANDIAGAGQFVDLRGFGPSMGGNFGSIRNVPGSSSAHGGKSPDSNQPGSNNSGSNGGSPNGDAGSGQPGGTDHGKTPTTPSTGGDPDTNAPGGTNPPGTNPPGTEQPGTPTDNSGNGNSTPPTVTVPEPGSIGLLGLGLIGLALARRRSRSA